MRLTINGQTYRFWFRYYWQSQNGKRVRAGEPEVLRTNRALGEMMSLWRREHREVAECVIASVNHEGKGVFFATGKAVRWHEDIPNRLIAREHALEKAIDALASGYVEDGEPAAVSDRRYRAYRAAFLYAYSKSCTRHSPMFSLPAVAA
jgi:hypothetical protein